MKTLSRTLLAGMLGLLPVAAGCASSDRIARPITAREMTAERLEQRDEATQTYMEASVASERLMRGTGRAKTVKKTVSDRDGRTYTVTVEGQRVLDMGWTGAE